MIKILLMFSPLICLAGNLPDKNLTPGAVRDVSITDLCTKSTKEVRHTSKSMKDDVYRQYGLSAKNDPSCTGVSHSCYEVDHLISLELGGADDVKNLWPQLYDGQWNAHDKDKLENELHRRICSGLIDIKAAQSCIATDWIKCYQETFK